LNLLGGGGLRNQNYDHLPAEDEFTVDVDNSLL
jgi:hypothetical protein